MQQIKKRTRTIRTNLALIGFIPFILNEQGLNSYLKFNETRN